MTETINIYSKKYGLYQPTKKYAHNEIYLQ